MRKCVREQLCRLAASNAQPQNCVHGPAATSAHEYQISGTNSSHLPHPQTAETESESARQLSCNNSALHVFLIGKACRFFVLRQMAMFSFSD